jgi:plasmid stabilization system protein ParE
VFSLPYERHVIFYEMHLDRCYILRILHAARDVHQAFP